MGLLLKERICTKWIYSGRKELAPSGTKFFPFRVDPFSEVRQNNFNRFASLKVHRFLLKYLNIIWIYFKKLIIACRQLNFACGSKKVSSNNSLINLYNSLG